MTTTRFMVVMTLIGLMMSFSMAPALAEVSVGKGELKGSTLRIKGEAAVSGSTVTVRSSDSLAAVQADNRGRWEIQANNFSVPDCLVVVDDGTGAVGLTLDGCTPVAGTPDPAPAPPPEPAPANLAPNANAGPDQAVIDTDGDGFAVVTYNGAASSDADGTITGYAWTIQNTGNTPLGTAPTVTVTHAVGTYVVELTVTDNAGAQSVDVVTVTVAAATPSVPQGAALGVLESDQAWSGSFDSTLMGASVASAGDVNGDGFDDVLVGALGYDAPGGLFDEGAVFVFLGGPNGVTGNSPATAHAAIIGNVAASEFGTSVNGAGDINGDGFDDIIVGAPLQESSGLMVSGAAYIFLGGPSGITAASPADANFVLESLQIQAWFGHDVAGAGDVNGDGFDDVIVGAPRYGQPFNPPIQNQGSGEQGAVFVFLGSASGLVGSNPSDAHAMIVPVSTDAPSQIRAFFGGSVDAAGDINGDGYADVVIGATGWNRDRPWLGLGTEDPPSEGAAFIYLGGPSGITGTNPTNAAARIDGDQLNAFMGNDVAGAGDVNADGFDDVLVGASGYPAGDPLLRSQEGAAFLFFGSPSGISATGAAQAQWSVRGTLGGERLGRAVGCAGDVNGDGLSDLIIGARNFAGAIADDAVYNGSIRLTGEGIAYVFTGSAADLATAAVTVRSGQEAGSAGYSVGGPADVNGDGLSDLIVGVPGFTRNQVREGAAFIHLSDGTSPAPPQVN